MTEAMLTLSLIADFTAESKSGILLGLSASSDGSVVAVLGHPLPHSVDAAATWAVVIDRSGMHERPLDPVEIPFGTEVEPQLTSDGSLLLVASRRRGGDNAVLFDPEGWWVRSFAVGDAVESALLDADDSLWVGYFDEGVFGDPLSRPGLARYSLDGRQTWAYAPTPGMAVIEDCYALNVAGSQAWAYSYPSFDLLRVEGHAVARWGPRSPGPTASSSRKAARSCLLAPPGTRGTSLDGACTTRSCLIQRGFGVSGSRARAVPAALGVARCSGSLTVGCPGAPR